MYLKNQNLIIRSAKIEDASILYTWWNDGSIMDHAGFPFGVGTSVEKVASQLAKQSEEKSCCLMIEHDSIPIGEMSYHNLGNKIAEIGIKICDTSLQEKGFGKVLLSMLIHSLFEDQGYEKIVLDTNVKNTRAQHVYEKLGFKQLRLNIDCWTNQLGESQSSIDYELYKKDFVPFGLEL